MLNFWGLNCRKERMFMSNEKERITDDFPEKINLPEIIDLPEIIELKDLDEFDDIEVLASKAGGCHWK